VVVTAADHRPLPALGVLITRASQVKHLAVDSGVALWATAGPPPEEAPTLRRRMVALVDDPILLEQIEAWLAGTGPIANADQTHSLMGWLAPRRGVAI